MILWNLIQCWFANYRNKEVTLKIQVRFGELKKNVSLLDCVVACSNVTTHIMSFVQYNELKFLFGLFEISTFCRWKRWNTHMIYSWKLPLFYSWGVFRFYIQGLVKYIWKIMAWIQHICFDFFWSKIKYVTFYLHRRENLFVS